MDIRKSLGAQATLGLQQNPCSLVVRIPALHAVRPGFESSWGCELPYSRDFNCEKQVQCQSRNAPTTPTGLKQTALVV